MERRLGGGYGAQVKLASYPTVGDGVPLVKLVTAIQSAGGQGWGGGLSWSALVRGLLLLSAGVRRARAWRRVSQPFTPPGSADKPRLPAVPPLARMSDLPPGGRPRPPPLRLLGAHRGQVPRQGARGHDGAHHPKAERVGVLVQDCPREGREAAQGEVDCDVAGCVGRHGHVHRHAGLLGAAHNIMGHACRGRRGAGRLVVPRRCSARALLRGAVARSEVKVLWPTPWGVVVPPAWLGGVSRRAVSRRWGTGGRSRGAEGGAVISLCRATGGGADHSLRGPLAWGGGYLSGER